jgi:uncharacterized protein YyaL (SSP411 family)
MNRASIKPLIAAAVVVACCVRGAMGGGIAMHDYDKHDVSRPPGDGRDSGNRLRGALSPYLLQHADNPVDWYPWGEEAFAEAVRLDRPVFLSIGYSSCHWCHVMEEESFEDEETARILNGHFVSIKVDREERPDIDNIYMKVCQAMTGSGGWPLTIVMTPDKKPFFAGTYFPKTARFGRPGLGELLTRIAGLWESDREQLLDMGDRIAESLSEDRFPGGDERLDTAVLREAHRDFSARYDDRYGGFGTAPKFPSPHTLSFLLRAGRRFDDEAALRMVGKTLDAMRRGGIHDHLGGGFHRYSTDEQWLVPHFEKMLYDQAMLAVAYAEAFQVTRRMEYEETVRDIFNYVRTSMTAPGGGFYSAEDADSEGIEGAFYTWRREEIIEILGPERGGLFSAFHGVTADGHLEGRSVLHEAVNDEAFAAEWGMEVVELRDVLAECRRTLLAVRRKRVPPLKDDKVLTDWNGLMIAALAIGSRMLGDTAFAGAASRAADFMLPRRRGGDTGIYRRLCVSRLGVFRALRDDVRRPFSRGRPYPDRGDDRSLLGRGARRISFHRHGRRAPAREDEGDIRRRDSIGQFDRRVRASTPGPSHGERGFRTAGGIVDESLRARGCGGAGRFRPASHRPRFRARTDARDRHRRRSGGRWRQTDACVPAGPPPAANGDPRDRDGAGSNGDRGARARRERDADVGGTGHRIRVREFSLCRSRYRCRGACLPH